MKMYRYNVKLSIDVLAETEEEAEDTIDIILPSGDGVCVDLIDLRETEEISFNDAMDWYKDR